MAVSIAVVLEGLAYALWPDGMKRMALVMLVVPAERLRLVGLAAAVCGVIFVAMLRG